MKAPKRFDCVQMKNDIQAQLLKEYAGLTDGEQMDSMRKELSASDAPAAKFWRRMMLSQNVKKVAEDRAAYK